MAAARRGDGQRAAPQRDQSAEQRPPATSAEEGSGRNEVAGATAESGSAGDRGHADDDPRAVSDGGVLTFAGAAARGLDPPLVGGALVAGLAALGFAIRRNRLRRS
jgi:hypothetical protein